MTTKNYITLDQLIKDLSAVKKIYGGDIPVVYSSDDEGNRFCFTEYNAGAMFFAGSPKKNRHSYSLEPVSEKTHADKNTETFVALIVN